MYKLVLIRHGESDWTKENRFTGWTDVDLSKGIFPRPFPFPRPFAKALPLEDLPFPPLGVL